MIIFVDESGSITTSILYTYERKKIRLNVFGKKDLWSIMSTSCYLGSGLPTNEIHYD